MNLKTPLLRGRLVARYKRFFADVQLADGETVTAHCPNPGSMMGLAVPGSEAFLSVNDDPKRRLRHTLELVGVDGALIGVNTGHANRIVAEALAEQRIPALCDYTAIRREVLYGEKSRVDFLLADERRAACYVEVKSVTLSRARGLAEFPDCVTARGARHLAELAATVKAGHRAVMLFLVQRDDCTRFALAADLDPAYAAAFAAARAAGVEAHCFGCSLSPEAITLAGRLPMAGERL